MGRILVQVTMPHSRPAPGSNELERRNGYVSLHMVSPARIGLPYGSYPRLLLAWLTTEAVRSHSRRVDLGDSLGTFMRRMSIPVISGRRGTVSRLRDQMKRLFGCSVRWIAEPGKGFATFGVTPIEDAELWWDPQRPEQIELWSSTVTLSERFYRELVERPVPIDMRALRALHKSPLALDLYSWLTYRMSYLEREQLVRWDTLQLQFGADYGRTRDFRAAFARRLKSVLEVYPAARVSPDLEGLILSPSPTHVPRHHLA